MPVCPWSVGHMHMRWQQGNYQWHRAPMRVMCTLRCLPAGEGCTWGCIWVGRWVPGLVLSINLIHCGNEFQNSVPVRTLTSGEAETQARYSIVQGELHFGRRDLGRTCLAAGACSTTTGGETAALLPLTAVCRTPRALTSTNRRGVVRSRNQRGVARIGQERSAGAREALRAITSTKSPASTRQKCNDEDYRPQE